MKKLVLAVALALGLSAPSLAHEGHDHTAALGTVNSVDTVQHKVNLSHGPIPQLGWPAMTMDFPVAPTVDLRGIAAGTKVEFTIGKGAGGAPEVQSLKPVTESK